MKLFRMLGRSIRDAFKSVIRNFSLSLASISCITITLIIVTVAIIATFNVQNFTKEIEKDMTIVVFLDGDATEEDVEAVKDKIDKIENVDKYTYQTKIEVKEQMQAESEVFNTVLSNFDENESPLKDTFQVKVKEIEKIKQTAEKIEKAINILRERRIEAFKKAVAEGRESEFLSAMNWTEKISLKVDMGLSRLGIPSEKPLTEENQRYLDILEQSIDKDIEQEAFRQGFSSVEEWQEYNSSIMDSEIEVEIEPEMESDMISIFSRSRKR